MLKDEIVRVCRAKNSIIPDSISLPDLRDIPLLLREPGSGTLDVIADALKARGLKLSDLRVERQLSGTESIKSYLLHADCLAFLSIYAVFHELQNMDFRIVDIREMEIGRFLYFIELQGQVSALPELFIKFAGSYNFR